VWQSMDNVPFESLAHRTTARGPNDRPGLRVVRIADEWTTLWFDLRGGQPPPNCPPDPPPPVDWGRTMVIVAVSPVSDAAGELHIRTITHHGAELRVEAVEIRPEDMVAVQVLGLASHSVAIPWHDFDHAELVVSRHPGEPG
jgi:hypothetical protein